jgi:hypothetical protein
MIGSVFAVALLIIVYSVVTGMHYPYSGLDSAKAVVLEAQKAPNKCFGREAAMFGENEAIGIQDLVVSGVSISFRSTSLFSCSGVCTAKRAASAPVSAKCSSSTSCTLYLGDKDCSI